MNEEKKKKGLLKFFVKLAVSVGILCWCFSVIDIKQLPKFIAGANPSLLILAYLLDVCGNLLCPALITKLAISTHRISIPLRSLIKINFVIRFYTLFLPTGVTAGIRWLKYKKYGAGQDAAALILFEKLLQVFLLTFTVLIFALIDYQVLGKAIVSTLLFISLLLFLAILSLTPFFSARTSSLIHSIILKTERLLPGIVSRIAKKLLEAAAEFQSVGLLIALKIIGVAVLGHTFLVFGLYTLSLSLDIGLDLIAITWIRALALLVMLVPITVANLGLREGSFIACMQFYKIPGYQAMGFGLTLTAFQVVNGVIGASFELWENIISPTLRKKETKQSISVDSVSQTCSDS